MKEDIIAFGTIFGLVALGGAVTWWQIFRWQECRQVGHSLFYCFITMGGGY